MASTPRANTTRMLPSSSGAEADGRKAAADARRPNEEIPRNQPKSTTNRDSHQASTTTSSSGSRKPVSVPHQQQSTRRAATSTATSTPSQMTPDEEMVLAHAGSLEFASSLHDDEDDVNLYLIAEMLREKKRKTDRKAAEVSYREPFSSGSSPSSCTDSLQSRLKARSQEGSSSSAASSAFDFTARSRSSEVSRSASAVSASMVSAHTAQQLSSTRMKSRTHRSSYSSVSGPAAVAAAVASAVAAPPQTTVRHHSPNLAPLPLSVASGPMSGCSTPNPGSPSTTSMQARKRQRDQSRMAQASDMALSNELEKMVMEAAKPAASLVDTLDPVEIALDPDTEMASEGSDEIQIQFHDCEQSSPSPSALASSLPPPSVEPILIVITPPATFATFCATGVVFAHALSYLDLVSKTRSMGVSRRFRDVMLQPTSTLEGATAWQGSRWHIGGGSSSLFTAKYLTKVNATYGVQECHKDWIITANPPTSFLLSRLEHLSLAQDEASASASCSSSSTAAGLLGDAHLVLLPYFAAVRTLDFSHVTSMAPRLTATSLARVALLPMLETLILDHCGSWVDDLALASLRHKDHVAQSALPMSQWRFLPPTCNLPRLKKLSLEFCSRLTPRSIEYLVGSNGLPSLVDLNLANCAAVVSTESMAALRWNTPMLRQLNLSWTVGTGADGAAMLRPLFSVCTLTSLELRGWSCLRDNTFPILLSQSGSVSGPSLQSLNLRECGGMGPAGLASITAMATLTAVDLSDCRGVTDAVLATFGARLSALKALTLWNATNITDLGIEALLFGGTTMQGFFDRATATTSAPPTATLFRSLQSLRLSSSPSIGAGACAALARCQSLTELELSDASRVDDAAIASLVDSTRVGGALACTLKTLLLPRLGAGFTSASGVALGQLGMVHELDVSFCEGVDDSFLLGLLQGPTTTRKLLHKLHLSRCPISATSLAALVAHSLAVARHGVDVSVDVKYCPHLTAHGVGQLKLAHPRIKVHENLAEYVQTPLPTPTAATAAVVTPRRRGSVSKRGSSSGRSPSTTDGGFRIENQLVDDDDESDENDDEGEDDDEDDEEESDDSDVSMSNEMVAVAFHTEETEAGEVWAVHDDEA